MWFVKVDKFNGYAVVMCNNKVINERVMRVDELFWNECELK